MHCPDEVAILIPYQMQLKLLCQSMYCPERVVDLIPNEDKLKLIISFNTLSRRGGSFDPLSEEFKVTMAIDARGWQL